MRHGDASWQRSWWPQGNSNWSWTVNDTNIEVPSLRVEQAADFLGLSKGTLDQWRHECRGPTYFKVGGQVRYRKADLLAFIKIYTTSDQA